MAHRDRVVPTPDQLPMLARHCADARYVWNLALEQANCYRPGRPTPGSAERFHQLAEARKGTWLGEGLVHPGFPGDSGPWIPSSLVVLSCAA